MSTNQLPYTRSCFVCGAENPQGLRLRFRQNGDAVEGEFTPRAEHIGFRGIIHGGILATVLDEAMVWAAAVGRKRFYFCVELTVRYSKSVTLGQTYTLVARTDAGRGRVVETAGELRDPSGTVCVRATAKYLPVPDSQLEVLCEDFVRDERTLPLENILGGA